LLKNPGLTAVILVMLTLGIGAGLITAVLLVRFLRSLLFEVAPYDPLVFSGVAVFLTVVVFLACYSSAHRATKVDPMVALRYE